ncbi:hypothetical protein EVAR_41729_1 [Eumeta japonica]|uniref:Uncharacterized protein n=1 Tax=Eumeta variegata TaxID=151549 RepID=A0A4C1XHG2_EUMVA|nr:hypothetical protein EVAR_41729_1 [Eumeta japonica]
MKATRSTLRTRKKRVSAQTTIQGAVATVPIRLRVHCDRSDRPGEVASKQRPRPGPRSLGELPSARVRQIYGPRRGGWRRNTMLADRPNKSSRERAHSGRLKRYHPPDRVRAGFAAGPGPRRTSARRGRREPRIRLPDLLRGHPSRCKVT